MEGLNQVTLLGNIAEPEFRVGASGAGVLKLRLATTESWFNKETNSREERSEWHSVTVFGKRGEALAKILVKGDRILITGAIRSSTYDKDGEKRYRFEIVANDVILNGKGKGAPTATSTTKAASPPSSGDDYPASWDGPGV